MCHNEINKPQKSLGTFLKSHSDQSHGAKKSSFEFTILFFSYYAVSISKGKGDEILQVSKSIPVVILIQFQLSFWTRFYKSSVV